MVFIDMSMLDKLAGVTAQTAIYPDVGSGSPLALLYVGCGLAGEAGETVNQLKKVVRDDHGVMTGPRQQAILKELGGTFWYWLRACVESGLDPSTVVYANLALLEKRQREDLLRGDDPADGGERQGPPTTYRPPRKLQTTSTMMGSATNWSDEGVARVVTHPTTDMLNPTPEQRQDALYREQIAAGGPDPLPVWWKVTFVCRGGKHNGNTMNRIYLAHTTVGATAACTKSIRRAEVTFVGLATAEDMKYPKGNPRSRG